MNNKTFTGTVLITDGWIDSSGDVFPPDTKVEFPETIIVTNGFDTSGDIKGIKPVGLAKLKRDGNKVTYDMEINMEKIPEQVARMLYPCVGGIVIERDGNTIKHCKITSIGLASPNTDIRIKKLGEE